MAATADLPVATRHPWLNVFEANPAGAFDDLVRGYAEIPPYERADAPDAARLLFRGLPDDFPARAALGPAIIAWIDNRRRQPVPFDTRARGRLIREVSETFEIVAILEVRDAALWLTQNRVRLTDWLTRLILSPARDARAAFLRMLALTQPLLEDDDTVPTLAPLWMELCRNAGGPLPQHYLTIGLLGQRRLPHTEGQTTEAPWIAGLANWALDRSPSNKAFMAQWLPLKRLYPRQPKAWRKEIGALLRTPHFRNADIAPPAWWGDDPDFKPLSRPGAVRQDGYRSPMPDECQAVVERLEKRPFREVEAKIDRLMQAHTRFARATGVSDYLVRAAHQLGSALVRLGGAEECAKAQRLARLALRWQPFNAHAWGIWADALAVAGALQASEIVRWEYMRRLPFNIDARNQLAEFLIARGRADDARRIVDESFAEGFVNEVTHSLRARLDSHFDGADAAHAALEAGRVAFPDDQILASLGTFLDRDEALILPSRHYQDFPLKEAENASAEGVIEFEKFAAGRALGERLARPDNDAAVEEVRELLAAEPEFAYAQLLAARAGIWEQAATELPSFPAAFEHALGCEDRDALSRIAEQAPRLEALTLLARAIFGDPDAQIRIADWLAHEEPDEPMAIASMRPRLRVVLGDGTDREHLIAAIPLARGKVVAILRRVNEAMLGEELLAA